MHFNKKISSTILLSIFSIVISYSQNIENKINDILNKEYSKDGTGGVALVSKGGRIIYHNAFGLANLELNTPMAKDMVFEIGSITKQFTAIAILMLKEQGKLDLEDDIKKYLPNYPSQGKTITIHNLLNHTSGIKNYVTLKEWFPLIRKDFTPKNFIDFFKEEPLNFNPGDKWEYSNSGYYILGHIIEKISGQSYGDFIESKIFKPLEMENSYYANHSKLINKRALGYSKQDNSIINANYVSYSHLYSAGALMSTTEDLFKWNQALVENTLITEESKKMIFTNTTLNDGSKTNYSYGWAINTINESNTIEHSGGTLGYASYATYLPKEDIFVTVFSNCDCNEPRVVTTKIAAIVLKKPFPSKVLSITLDNLELKQLVGTYTFEDGSTRIVTLNDKQLFVNFPDMGKLKIFTLNGRTFWIEGTTENLSFKTTNQGTSCVFKNRIYKSIGYKD